MTAMADHGADRRITWPLIWPITVLVLTIQLIAFLLFVLGAGYLLNNALTNLAAQGQDFSFRFLGQTAGYDINQ